MTRSSHTVFGVRRATDNAEEDRKAFRAYVEGGARDQRQGRGATDGRAPSRETRPGKGADRSGPFGECPDLDALRGRRPAAPSKASPDGPRVSGRTTRPRSGRARGFAGSHPGSRTRRHSRGRPQTPHEHGRRTPRRRRLRRREAVCPVGALPVEDHGEVREALRAAVRRAGVGEHRVVRAAPPPSGAERGEDLTSTEPSRR